MSVFWRPVQLLEYVPERGDRTKRLGAGLYVLWCRCDFCSWSGSATHFVWFHRGPDITQLCENCTGDERILRPMLAESWEPVG